MPTLPDQIIFDYFRENNREITITELSTHFDGISFEGILKPINSLIYQGYLEETNESLCWRLSEKAKQAIKEGAETKKQELAHKAREVEKTKIDLEIAKKMLKEYPTTKRMARYGFIIAIILAAIELLRYLNELTSE